MKELTPSQIEVIDKAAESYAEGLNARITAKNDTARKEAYLDGCEDGFEDGASFALTNPDLLKDVLIEVLEFSREAPGNTWLFNGDVITTAELVMQFFTDKNK